ncbi:unnamed protein product [Timema podura]|uniref:DM10 domain-containing protein n=1 Tax=Timema podura TaxID=61482 RepID=A0ABN7PNV8_TIMPD|nr:unnamed protein product [Timema podura]
MTTDKYSFIAEWYDDEAALTKTFQLSYFLEDNTIELYELKTRRLFLKRIQIPTVNLGDMYIGSTLYILSRNMRILDFANEFTRSSLGKFMEVTFAMLKPEALDRCGEILDFIMKNKFIIAKMKMVCMEKSHILDLYREHVDKAFMGFLLDHLTSPCLAMKLVGKDAVARWRESQEDAKRELEMFFPTCEERIMVAPRTSALLENTTLCLVKPHAVRDGLLGLILSEILRKNFQITAMQMFNMVRAGAEEFYEVYNGVVPEFVDMVNELLLGPCVAIELIHPDGDTHTKFRELTGPRDPEVAKELEPDSLRAKFGWSKVHNAVHCTDLPEDCASEVGYFFVVLQ